MHLGTVGGSEKEEIMQKLYNNMAWLITPLLMVGACVMVIRYVHWPIGQETWKKGMHIYKQYNMVQQAGFLPREYASVRKDIATLDSLIRNVQKTEKTSDDREVVAMLYAHADSLNVKTSKVEIGEPIQLDTRQEIPIVVRGTGSYQDIGKFSGNIENIPFPTRIRHMVLKETENNDIEMLIDFVVMED
jgi:Tfp pilus assembly protein PilO